MKRIFEKPKTFVLLLVIVTVVVVASPYLLWYLQSSKPLEVLIVDKTVPDTTYREHKGLVWILNNEKYVKSNGQPYSPSQDYIGIKPLKNNEYRTMELPKNLSNYEVIYLADQYGVKNSGYDSKNKIGNSSENIQGGLDESEIEKIEKALMTQGKTKTLIAEFNTFGSPTSVSARNKISNLLNLDWSGWIGRYYSDLNGAEVPVWVKENYSKSRGEWDFKGGGFVFVDNKDFVVVLSKKDLTGSGAEFRLTQAGKERFDYNIHTKYEYWFDIVEARDNEEILAEYSLSVTDEAEKMMESYGIPVRFPAIISHQNAKYSSYYFAGDYADEAEVPSIYQTRGLDLWKMHVGLEKSFYWDAYVPIMNQLLETGLHTTIKQENVELIKQNGIKSNSRTGDKFIQIQKDGKWEDIIVKGVNLGIAKPGYFPGEAAITKDEYFRWFKAIGDMNANAIRIYTLHPPAFYEAFYKYNQIASKPLYLFHGAWINEEELVRTGDAFANENISNFKTEIKYMIDIIHGQGLLPERAGHASGKYSWDISKFVLGYIIGIEWDPNMVLFTDNKHRDLEQFSGQYFKTSNATPFEIWLARMMDSTTSYETENYQWQHTMSFTNWVTTDLLEHPAEPSEQEDLVTVDPNHIRKSDKFQAGLFASYHIYPYYPDFLNFEDKYVHYKDAAGEKNNYAGYLRDLIHKHEIPIIVAEFGVPASRGLTHENVYGMNQGRHSEEEQGNINKRLYQSIVSEGYGGGLVFAWQDEWFKRTWNTMDFDNPDRRPYWSNMQTNEQHFGLLSFDPGRKETAIYVDGVKNDWNKLKSMPLYKSKVKNSTLNEVRISSDEGYLYFILDYHKPVIWQDMNTYLLLDTIDNQGQTVNLVGENATVRTDYGIDFMVRLLDTKNSDILVDSYYDAFYFQYGEILKMIPKAPYANQKDNGIFHPIRLALNKELTIPSTGTRIPFQDYETGKLKFGNANPSDKEYNSLTDISISKDKRIVEGRIPWQLLNMKDPSLKEATGDLWETGLTGNAMIEGIRIAIVEVEKDKVKSTNPKLSNGILKKQHVYLYKWDEWNEPSYHERLKSSYEIMKETYRSIK